MRVSDFDYNLPEKLIAIYPPQKRGNTKLLVLNRQNGQIADSLYASLGSFLRPGDLLILNDTKVMRSRLHANLPDGRPRELIVLEKHTGTLSKVLYRGKLHDGDILTIPPTHANQPAAQVKVISVLGNGVAQISSSLPLENLATQYGTVPLPPYLHRNATASDISRYQTVWAKQNGSAAAPTASLNMTKDLLISLIKKGIQVNYLTLHVGLGTFLPIRTDNVEEHKMHSEWFHIPEDTLAAIKSAKSQHRRVIALGTTVARTLEYYGRTGRSQGEDDIFIYPGFKFTIINGLITNFHAPKSTVLMLAAAFAGWDHLKVAYQHAIRQNYHFLSYGDSMFIC